MNPCSVGQCGRKVKAKGLCVGHYNMNRLGKELKEFRVYGSYGEHKLPCKVDGCKTTSKSQGYCSTHYNQIWKHGGIRPKRCERGLPVKVPCITEGCLEVSRCRGMCAKHYHHWYYYIRTDRPVRPKRARTRKECVAPECLSKATRKYGYCKKHYNRIILGLTPKKRGIAKGYRFDGAKVVKVVKEGCAVESCTSYARCKGYCSKHYRRWLKHGDATVNYARQYRRPRTIHTDNIMRPEKGNYNRFEENEIIRQEFGDFFGFEEHE